MAKSPIDRRVARTRASLHRSLMSLILEKGYDSTTVEEICARADVGRSTFYAHFTCKEDLKRSGLDNLRRELASCQAALSREAPALRLGFSLPMFQHAHDHVEHYRALVGSRGGDVSLGVIRETLSELVRQELVSTADDPPLHAPVELVVRHVVGAFMSVMTWWLDGGARLPPEEVDKAFRALAIEGLAADR